MPDRSERDVGLRDLCHLDCGLHASVNADPFQRVLQGQRVHHGGQHPHVVGPGPVHVGSLTASPDVPSPHHDRHLDAQRLDLPQLGRQEVRRL